jgi:NTE family protein/lysophospholipid hydrolase
MAMTLDSWGTESIADALREADVFRDLPDAVRSGLAARMSPLALAAGETLIDQGQQGDRLFVVLAGELDVHATTRGGAVRQMPRAGRCRVLGEASLLIDSAVPCTARAHEGATIAALSRESFAQFGEENPLGMFLVMEALRPALTRHRLRVALHTHGTFGDLDPAALEDLESSLEFVGLFGGEVLMRQGDLAEDMYIVLSGRLRVTATQADGSQRTIAELGSGETVGEMALVTGDPRVATVHAVRDTQLARLTRTTFERLLERHPRTTFDLIATRLVTRLRIENSRARLQRSHSLATVAVVPASPGVPLRAVCDQLAAALSRLGPTLQLSSDLVDRTLGTRGVAQAFDHEHHGAHLCEWLAGQELAHRFVLYRSDPGLSPWTERSIRQADHVIVVGDVTADPGPGEIETEILAQSRFTAGRTLALVHPPAGMPSGTRRWLDPRNVSRHVHLRLDHAAHFDRLARLITGNAVALTLGGGFARGLAHLGVFRALEELGVPVDVVGGSSMGAMVGAQWALGWRPEDMAKRTAEGFAASLDDMTLPFLSFKRGGKHSRLIRDFFGDTQIEDLWYPYFCVSTNLNRSQIAIHTTGSLSEAVTASTRAPGIFPPLVIAGELHVDGGLINNVPVDVMSDFANGGIVIGVDVSPPHELGEVHNYGHDVSGWQAAWSRFNPNRQKRSYRPSILIVLMRVIEFGGISYRRTKAEMADLYISPDVLRFKRNDFAQFAGMGDAGYAAAHPVLRKWLAEGHGAYGGRRPDLFRRADGASQSS